MTTDLPRICYFGIYDPHFSRNKVYRSGLKRLGVQVVECRTTVTGWRKYWHLWRQYRTIRHDYDVMIVGYPGYIIVPFAKLISTFSGKPVVFDALCSFHEAQIISRNAYEGIPLRSLYTRTIDWLANSFADLILVETEAQKSYYITKLSVPADKVSVVYTGVDDETFHPLPSSHKAGKFTVLFRGRLMKEAGVTYILEAARILEKENVHFIIIGFGYGETVHALEKQFQALHLGNTEFIPRQLPIDELKRKMAEAQVSLGQFEKNERVDRTIPHKAFESMALKIPYITGYSQAVSELLQENESCLYVPLADAEALAKSILTLKNDPAKAERLAENAFQLYKTKLTSEKLARTLLEAVQSLLVRVK